MHPKESKKENVKFDDAKDVFVTLAGERTRDIRLKGHKRAAIWAVVGDEVELESEYGRAENWNDPSEWELIVECHYERFIWDHDFHITDFGDAPPDVAARVRREAELLSTALLRGLTQARMTGPGLKYLWIPMTARWSYQDSFVIYFLKELGETRPLSTLVSSERMMMLPSSISPRRVPNRVPSYQGTYGLGL